MSFLRNSGIHQFRKVRRSEVAELHDEDSPAVFRLLLWKIMMFAIYMRATSGINILLGQPVNAKIEKR